jgi:hypothetical protein
MEPYRIVAQAQHCLSDTCTCAYIVEMPPRKRRKEPDNPEQYSRFLELAKEVEADDTPGSLDRSFGKVVRPAKPKKDGTKKDSPTTGE